MFSAVFFWEWCWFHKIPSFEVQMMPQNNAMHQGPAVTMDPWETAGFWLRNCRSPWFSMAEKWLQKKKYEFFKWLEEGLTCFFLLFSYIHIWAIIGNKLPVGNGGLAKEHLPNDLDSDWGRIVICPLHTYIYTHNPCVDKHIFQSYPNLILVLEVLNLRFCFCFKAKSVPPFHWQERSRCSRGILFEELSRTPSHRTSLHLFAVNRTVVLLELLSLITSFMHPAHVFFLQPAKVKV